MPSEDSSVSYGGSGRHAGGGNGWTEKAAVSGLIAIGLLATFGVMHAALREVDIPPALTGIAGMAAGALGGMLPRTKR